uniref:Uncharacterized protein n=1 Tax=viral metagenome TaxID=1070528 RepID=A0A6M3JGS9_9ZZZZ
MKFGIDRHGYWVRPDQAFEGRTIEAPERDAEIHNCEIAWHNGNNRCQCGEHEE